MSTIDLSGKLFINLDPSSSIDDSSGYYYPPMSTDAVSSSFEAGVQNDIRPHLLQEFETCLQDVTFNKIGEQNHIENENPQSVGPITLAVNNRPSYTSPKRCIDLIWQSWG